MPVDAAVAAKSEPDVNSRNSDTTQPALWPVDNNTAVVVALVGSA